jgi:hypothetical protein
MIGRNAGCKVLSKCRSEITTCSRQSKDDYVESQTLKRKILAQKRLLQKSRDIEAAKYRHETIMDTKRSKYMDYQDKISKQLEHFEQKKTLEYSDLKRKQQNRSQIIDKTIEKARRIEEYRRNRILQKEAEREERLLKRQQRRMSHVQNQKEQYRQVVKIQSDILEQQRRDRYLQKLLANEDKFCRSISIREESL